MLGLQYSLITIWEGLIISPLNLCFLIEVHWDMGACAGILEPTSPKAPSPTTSPPPGTSSCLPVPAPLPSAHCRPPLLVWGLAQVGRISVGQ